MLVRVFDDEDSAWVREHGGTPIVYSDAAAEEFASWFKSSGLGSRTRGEAEEKAPTEI